METARCPGCGAAVRPDASWCSLCYQDLRPEPLLVTAQGSTVPADAAADSPASADCAAAPLVDALLEPEAARERRKRRGGAAPWPMATSSTPNWSARTEESSLRAVAPTMPILQPVRPRSALPPSGCGGPSKLAALRGPASAAKCLLAVNAARSAAARFLSDLRDGSPDGIAPVALRWTGAGIAPVGSRSPCSLAIGVLGTPDRGRSRFCG